MKHLNEHIYDYLLNDQVNCAKCNTTLQCDRAFQQITKYNFSCKSCESTICSVYPTGHKIFLTIVTYNKKYEFTNVNMSVIDSIIHTSFYKNGKFIFNSDINIMNMNIKKINNIIIANKLLK